MTVTPPEIEVDARLAVAIETQTDLIREADERQQKLFADISYFPGQAAQFSALPYTMKTVDFGPKPGFNWAVQAVAVEGLGTSDVLNLYRGQSTSGAVAGYGRFTFTVTAANTIASWIPGRSGFILRGRSLDSIIFAGSIAGTVTVNVDVIQVTDEYLPHFLVAT